MTGSQKQKKKKNKKKKSFSTLFGIVILEADEKKKSIFLSNSLDLRCLNTATYPLNGVVMSIAGKLVQKEKISTVSMLVI